MAEKYRALVGFNYPRPNGKGEIRVEAEAEVDNLPPKVVAVLLEQEAIVPVDGGRRREGKE